MGAGKTTVANALAATRRYRRLSFADPLRYLTTLLLGRPIDKKTDRGVLQRVGGAARSPAWQGIDTPLEPARQERVVALAAHLFPGAPAERVRALHDALYLEGYAYGWGHPEYWIGRWRRDHLRSPGPVVVDDLRFPIEGDYLRRLGFFVVYLDVPLAERQRRIVERDGLWDPAWSTDPTEALVEGIPYHLKLDGTATPDALCDRIVREAAAWQAARGATAGA
jgi:hypothetical protein